MNILHANIEEEKPDLLSIKSPILGFLKLLVNDNDHVYKGQNIAIIKRLENNYYINIPDNIEGLVYEINNNDSVDYDSFIIKLKTSKDIHLDHKSKNNKDIIGINSTMDGTIYLSNSPSEPNFINEGDTVKPGQILGLIEVMKSFYPIKYEGKESVIIEKILVKHSSSIGVNELLFTIKKVAIS